MNVTQTATTTLPPEPAQRRLVAPEPAAAPPPPFSPDRRPSRRRRRRTFHYSLLASAAVALTVWAGLRWWVHAGSWVETDNAYIAAHVHAISARVAGTVAEVLVEENAQVEAGAVLARLDARDFEVRRAQAEAQVLHAAAEARQAEAKIAEAGAQVSQAQAHATKASLDLDRAAALFEGTSGAISRQEYDQAKAEADSARAACQGAEAAQRAAEALLATVRAQQQVAQAALRDAELQCSYTAIVAPAAGRIGRKNLEVGNRVLPGQVLVALVQPEIWVTANFKETQLSRLRAGQSARLHVDAIPGQVFTGHVQSLSPASGAQFALLPPDNATGNFTRIVQRVPVKLVFEPQCLADYANRIVPGMSVIAEVKVR